MTPDRHPGFGIPSNARYRQHAHPFREWERTDPCYADHRPLERADWRELVGLIPAAVVVVAGLAAFCWLVMAVMA